MAKDKTVQRKLHHVTGCWGYADGTYDPRKDKPDCWIDGDGFEWHPGSVSGVYRVIEREVSFIGETLVTNHPGWPGTELETR